MSDAFVLTVTIIAGIFLCFGWFCLPGWLVVDLFVAFAGGVVTLLVVSYLIWGKDLADPSDTITETLVLPLTGSRADVEWQMDELCRFYAQLIKTKEK
ncbi:hypothetical protein A2482_01425 [Candidatus Falkowbacteria bacterium RIFOXYC2_FULL_48_21]|uniref:Uncharacterized protein n=1 Tax=Candidatus Falkowbacteria bacterium RIFOXYC2_FULL_48_21 TaxID=1798005 RepID=A0A1F5T6F3_9BACT|nr:MAG: hypothetical protein A2482_01425 [Candidatus Falkowbacteria bacterium RIFOXYC2_FULL_48_21]